jgi:hypothetical protein
MMSTINQYHYQKCGVGFDTEEKLEQYDYDAHVMPLLLLNTVVLAKKNRIFSHNIMQ